MAATSIIMRLSYLYEAPTMCQEVSLYNLYAQQSWEVSYGPT